MEEKKQLTKILIETQKKHNCFNEILDLTNQMEDTMQRNDPISFQMLMGMRAEVMDKVDEINRGIEELSGEFSEEIQSLIKKQTSPDAEEEGDFAPELLKIGEITNKTKRILEKIITIDQVMNQKIAGDQSYYNQEK